MKRFTENKHERKIIYAKLIEKKAADYFPIPGKIPTPEQLYELVFETAEGIFSFEVSVFEYNIVEKGMEGTLVYQGCKLISFADRIKDVH